MNHTADTQDSNMTNHSNSSVAVKSQQSTTQGVHFEQALNELQTIVNQLNQPELSLDDALKLYEKGVHLAQHGKQLLAQAEHKIEHLRGSLGGSHESGS